MPSDTSIDSLAAYDGADSPVNAQLPTYTSEYMLPCMYKSMSGVECMGCGTQRAAIALTQGEWRDSLALNPSVVPLGITFGLLGLYLITRKEAIMRYLVPSFIVTVSVMVIHFLMKTFT